MRARLEGGVENGVSGVLEGGERQGPGSEGHGGRSGGSRPDPNSSRRGGEDVVNHARVEGARGNAATVSAGGVQVRGTDPEGLLQRQGGGASSAPAPTANAAVSESDELEGWLDSVLDDT